MGEETKEETALEPYQIIGEEEEEWEQRIREFPDKELLYELGKARKLYNGLVTRVRYVLGHAGVDDLAEERLRENVKNLQQQLLQCSDALEQEERKLFRYLGALIEETGKRMLGNEQDITDILNCVHEEVDY